MSKRLQIREMRWEKGAAPPRKGYEFIRVRIQDLLGRGGVRQKVRIKHIRKALRDIEQRRNNQN